MRFSGLLAAAAAAAIWMPAAEASSATYWSLFNVEGEADLPAQYVTYATLQDMLNDSNRLGIFMPTGGGHSTANIVGSGSDGTTYWNLFNVEGETSLEARYATYATLQDMLSDSNRLGIFAPNGGVLSAVNVVGSGSDGTTYWSLFNIEGETSLDARYVTYATLLDMLTDTNRVGIFTPDDFDGGRFAANIVGSGSDGTTYWSLFNIEGEASLDAHYVTYATLLDMLNDSNRLGIFMPDDFGGGRFARNIVGSGASPTVSMVPAPDTAWLLVAGLAGIFPFIRRRLRGGPGCSCRREVADTDRLGKAEVCATSGDCPHLPVAPPSFGPMPLR